jgi:ribosome-associated translation inhibitor RaiA
MQIQVSTDRVIEGGQQLTLQVQAAVEAKLRIFADRLTRVSVHLSDENSQKAGSDDKKCLLEARPAGMRPVVVTHKAATIELALDGAAEKLERLLDRTFARRDDPKGRTPYGGPE